MRPSTQREDSEMDTDSDADSVSSDETEDSDDDTDGDSESELNANAKNSTSGELPASAFPYQKDLLHSSNHYRKYPFDYTDESIEFVCRELHRHGFGFLMDDTELDPYQLDLLMITSWGVLHPLRCKQKHPSSKTMELLASDDTLKDLVISPVESEAESADDAVINETTTKIKLWHY
jgi:hypothetical protein